MLWYVASLFHRAYSRRSHVVRALAEDSKRSFWALTDQGVVSLGNFGLNIVLARFFERGHQLGEYGAFWVFMELMILLNGVQGALLVYPMTVRGAVLDRLGLGRMTSQALSLTLLSGPLLALALALVALVAQVPVIVGLWAGAALLMWQVQETTRRALMAHLRFRAALWGDATSYLGQFLGVAILSYLNALSLQRTFQLMALTSAAAWAVQSTQLRLRGTTLAQVIHFARDSWGIGRWMLFGNLTYFFNGALFNWNFAYWAGLEMLGVHYALMNLLRLANPLAVAIATLILPNAAKARSTQGMARAKIVTHRFTLLGALLMAPYLGVLLLWPGHSIAFAYGWGSAYLKYGGVVQISALAVALVYVATASGSLLNAVERSPQAFIGQGVYAVGFVAIVLPLTAVYGLWGAAWGWLVAAALRAVVNVYYVKRLPTVEATETRASPMPAAA